MKDLFYLSVITARFYLQQHVSEVSLHSVGEVSEARGLPQRPHGPSVSVPELLRQSPSNHVLLYRGSDGDF